MPLTLPALMRAQKLQKRAARFGCGPEDAAEAVSYTHLNRVVARLSKVRDVLKVTRS